MKPTGLLSSEMLHWVVMLVANVFHSYYDRKYISLTFRVLSVQNANMSLTGWSLDSVGRLKECMDVYIPDFAVGHGQGERKHWGGESENAADRIPSLGRRKNSRF